ncbi:hypothetical protein F5Y04DRAFT_278595 [Hypomontagnella monticulosa]|nr:hypothetical protein F5Y04DRAFT_278595 [Hypomontagnella monticulosa]
MQNPRCGRPVSWQPQYAQPQMNGPGLYPPQRPVSNPNSPNLLPQQPYRNSYTAPYNPAPAPSFQPYRPNQVYNNAPPAALLPGYGGGAPPQANLYLQPQAPQSYATPLPQSFGFPPQPPPPGPPPMQQPYANVPASLMPPRPPMQQQPRGLILQLRGENKNKTICMADPNGYPLYRTFETHRSTTSSRPDFVVAHAPSGAAVGSIRYHRLMGTHLDYWEVGGRHGGAGLFAWRLDIADERRGRWKCYRAMDLAGLQGLDKKRDAAYIQQVLATAPVIAVAEFDWAAGRKGNPDAVVGMCELYDARLLDRERSSEMVELYIMAVLVIGSAADAVESARIKGRIKTVADVVDMLSNLAAAGGTVGGDGGGGDGGGGGGDGGGGGGAA